MSKLLMMSCLLMSSLFATQAFSVERRTFVIPMHDQHYRGNSIIKLKEEIQNVNPGLRLNGSTLQSIVLVAKSKNGNGTADLVIDEVSRDRVRVPGSSDQFDNPRPFTYTRLVLRSPGIENPGTWQIHLNGNIKVKEIRATVDFLDLYYVNLATVETRRFSPEEIAIRGINRYGDALRIKALGGPVEIEKVKVFYRSGYVAQIPQFERRMDEGELKEVYIDWGLIEKITVKAYNPVPFGRDSSYRVQLGTYR